jgi:hypothetical protein
MAEAATSRNPMASNRIPTEGSVRAIEGKVAEVEPISRPSSASSLIRVSKNLLTKVFKASYHRS